MGVLQKLMGGGKRAAGKRATRSLSGAFDAAGFGRLLKDWNPGGSGANTAMLGGLVSMRNRSRDMARNNPWCASAIDSLVANITDPAIRPISKAPDEAFRAQVVKLWGRWGEEADAHGVLNWDLQVGLVLRSLIESGEVFVRMRPRRTEDGLHVPLQVQIIEADHVPADYTQTAPVTGNKIVAGVEFDKLNRRVAYWVYPEHPGESVGTFNANLTPVRVDASEIIHVFDPKRPGQVRGYPQMVPVLVRIRDLAKYEDAELLKQLVASLMVGVVTSPAPDADLLGEEDPSEDDTVPENTSWAQMQPGTFTVLEPGEEVTFNNPPAANGNYDPHVKMHLRAVAAAFGVTYEQMTGDLTGVNFSSIRAGLNEFQRRARRIQHLLIHQLCRRVWQRWMDEAVMVGALTAPGYATAKSDWQAVTWRPPGWRYVNPQQEITAVKEEIKAGLNSRQSVVAERGGDVNEVDAQQAEDHKRATTMGLEYDTAPLNAVRAGGGGGQFKPQTEDEAPPPAAGAAKTED